MALPAGTLKYLGLAGALAGVFGGIHALQGVLRAYEGHGGPVALEPVAHDGGVALAVGEGRRLVSLEGSGEVREWDLARSGSRSRWPEGRRLLQGYVVRGLALDPRSLFCAIASGRSVVVLPLEKRGRPWMIPGLISVTLSAGGRLLGGETRHGERLLVLDTATRREVAGAALPGSGPIRSMELSSDGRWVALAREGMRPRLWVAPLDGGIPFVLPEVDAASATLRFSPDGRVLAVHSAAPGGRALRLWDTRRWEPPLRIDTGPAEGTGLSFSPDGERIAISQTRARDYVVGLLGIERRTEGVEVLQVVDRVSGRLLLSERAAAGVRGHGRAIRDWAWLPGGGITTLGADGRIALWDARTGALLRFLHP